MPHKLVKCDAFSIGAAAQRPMQKNRLLLFLLKCKPCNALNCPRPTRKLTPKCSESRLLVDSWHYTASESHRGNAHGVFQLLEECFLTPSGSITIAGSRVGLSTEGENHLWSITTEGFICYSSAAGLVLDVKGQPLWDSRTRLNKIQLESVCLFYWQANKRPAKSSDWCSGQIRVKLTLTQDTLKCSLIPHIWLCKVKSTIVSVGQPVCFCMSLLN